MSITLIGYIAIPLLILMTVRWDIKKISMITFILSTMTSTTVLTINIVDFSIPIGYFSAICMICKVIFLHIRNKFRTGFILNKSLLIFIYGIALSLFIPIFLSKGVIVLTPDNRYSPITFNFQMITQFIYILFMVLIFIFYLDIMKNKGFTEEEFYNMIKYSLVLNIFLAFLQIIIPIDIFNNIFRTGHSNDQTIGGVIRLTAATMEASILSFVVVPMIVYLFTRVLRKFNLIDLIICVVMSLIVINGKSSTFFIGISIAIILIIINILIKLVYGVKIKKNQILLLCLVSMIITILITFFHNDISTTLIDLFNSVIMKISGDGISGMQRSTAFNHQINVFKNHILIGVGFGTVRSYDLFSTWLSELGILGVLPFVVFNIGIIFKLFISKSIYKMSIANIIILNLLMMSISVPEPYFIFTWFYYAYGYYLIKIYNIRF